MPRGSLWMQMYVATRLSITTEIWALPWISVNYWIWLEVSRFLIILIWWEVINLQSCDWGFNLWYVTNQVSIILIIHVGDFLSFVSSMCLCHSLVRGNDIILHILYFDVIVLLLLMTECSVISINRTHNSEKPFIHVAIFCLSSSVTKDWHQWKWVQKWWWKSPSGTCYSWFDHLKCCSGAIPLETMWDNGMLGWWWIMKVNMVAISFFWTRLCWYQCNKDTVPCVKKEQPNIPLQLKDNP